MKGLKVGLKNETYKFEIGREIREGVYTEKRKVLRF